ncbi:NADPH-dependent FMN reductase [Nakamurella leprariae]|uniref:NAD(P)H-dependent oxidoreductase n=1 Tax=Nakamurella leprariae TaxID=2803911 RepID=A0A938YFG8_9ACTN|nr:NAD(P)H-dependent oxidoreductase [Nakamurella leprariae]MBM9468576.1 NAD(P)H-dependent oxidoreductase [Nakamurella leprariae]
MRIAVLVGNPRPGSRTLQVADAVADVLEARLGPTDRLVIDLASVARDMFDWPSPVMTELTEQVADSDLLVVASPTYKGSYTGLLKAFLDRLPNNGLAGVCAVHLLTGVHPQHAMATEVHLRPLLTELGCATPTRGLYFLMSQMADLVGVVDRWADENAEGIEMIGAALAETDPEPVPDWDR